jgi:16S rRNA (cytidine1402-2'-O)-methyltransferase
MAAVSAAGLEAGPWVFAGFLPPGASEREQVLRQLAADPRPFVLFEAPHRIAGLLQLLARVAQPQRRVVLARELSKKFETISACRVDQLTDAAVEERGEYVIVVDATDQPHDIDPSLVKWLTALLGEMPPARAAAIAAKVSGQPKQTLYELTLRLKRQ